MGGSILKCHMPIVFLHISYDLFENAYAISILILKFCVQFSERFMASCLLFPLRPAPPPPPISIRILCIVNVSIFILRIFSCLSFHGSIDFRNIQFQPWVLQKPFIKSIKVYIFYVYNNCLATFSALKANLIWFRIIRLIS